MALTRLALDIAASRAAQNAESMVLFMRVVASMVDFTGANIRNSAPLAWFVHIS